MDALADLSVALATRECTGARLCTCSNTVSARPLDSGAAPLPAPTPSSAAAGSASASAAAPAASAAPPVAPPPPPPSWPAAAAAGVARSDGMRRSMRLRAASALTARTCHAVRTRYEGKRYTRARVRKCLCECVCACTNADPCVRGAHVFWPSQEQPMTPRATRPGSAATRGRPAPPAPTERT